MEIVDTHQHLWDLDRFPYTWCRSIPALHRSFRLADYMAAAEGTGITKTIFMECDVDEPHAFAEAESIEALAQQMPLIQGIVASGRPEHADFERHLDALAQLPHVRGVRRVLHTQPDALAESETFARNLRRLPVYRFTFDLCVRARQLPVALALVRRCPGVTFVLDHCGVPDVKSGAFDPWRTQIRELAEMDNVVCKISGLVAYADPQHWTTADLKPWVDHVLACFGWQRVVWGGDWPVCTLSSPLVRWVATTRDLVAQASAEDQAALFHRNAERIYRV